MKLYLAKEFTKHDWYPNYRQIKKKLRKNKLPFTIRKLSTENGLLHSIWSTTEHIEQVRDLVNKHYLNDPMIRNQIYRTEALAQEFEDKWIKNIFSTLTVKALNHPVLFIGAAIAVLAMVLFPFFQYH